MSLIVKFLGETEMLDAVTPLINVHVVHRTAPENMLTEPSPMAGWRPLKKQTCQLPTSDKYNRL